LRLPSLLYQFRAFAKAKIATLQQSLSVREAEESLTASFSLVVATTTTTQQRQREEPLLIEIGVVY